ncbi:MAG TPA: hypothetical protein VGL09_14080 [Methylomirabilota bacterium]|jgi:hypothetical protein
MADETGPESAGDRAYRRRFTTKGVDKHADYAVDLFHEAEQNLADVARVNRILLELGRFYNPLTDGAIVPLAMRQRIVGLLERGDHEEAATLLRDLLSAYTRAAATDTPAP